MRKDKTTAADHVSQLYLALQKVLRTLDFSKSMQAKAPSITVSQMRVLSFFNEHEVVHISELSRALGLSIQNVNNIVRRLEDADYVRRTPNRQNRRFSDIRLTAQGRTRFLSFRSQQFGTLTALLERLGIAERDALIKALNLAAGTLEKAASGAGGQKDSAPGT
jgi:DNA-binding MarR family transcriptional regulator